MAFRASSFSHQGSQQLKFSGVGVQQTSVAGAPRFAYQDQQSSRGHHPRREHLVQDLPEGLHHQALRGRRATLGTQHVLGGSSSADPGQTTHPCPCGTPHCATTRPRSAPYVAGGWRSAKSASMSSSTTRSTFYNKTDVRATVRARVLALVDQFTANVQG